MPEALVEVAFVVVGDLADYGFASNATDGIRQRLSQETGIPQDMISITAESASVRITATLRVPTNQEAETIVVILRTIFSNPGSASNVMNLNITHTELPLISRSVPAPPSANKESSNVLWMIIAISGGCVFILLAICAFRICRTTAKHSPPSYPRISSQPDLPRRTFLTNTELFARQAKA